MSSGRPSKAEGQRTSSIAILEATRELLKDKGAENITVRNVVEAAGISTGTFYHYYKNKDELMAHFVKSAIFPDKFGESDNVATDIIALYDNLFNTYERLGRNFMHDFYTPTNATLAEYLGQTSEHSFPPGSIMAISETLLLSLNIYNQEAAHQLAADLCTTFKGIVFEWCLGTLPDDPHATIIRLFSKQISLLK